MRVENSKQPENSSSQLSREITEGKRKRVSYREGLSMQDVFSDSGNATGSSQKTSLPSETERRKSAQLEGKTNR